MTFKKLLIAIGIGLALALVPSVASADEGDVAIRINGDLYVAPGESIGTAVVINGGAQIDGTVRDALLVIRGDAVITGTVEGDVTVINGSLRLANGSRIDNAHLFRSDLDRANAATVTGNVRERERVFFRGISAVASIIFWLAFTVAVIFAGLVFAAIGGRQLLSASNLLTERPGQSILAAVIVWTGIPVLAVIAFVTIVGIGVALGLLLFVLPALWFLGYIVAGTRLGTLVTGSIQRAEGGRPFLAAFIGLLALQFVALVPVIGWIVLWFAGLWGAGGLAYFAFRAARGQPAIESAAA